MHVNSKLPDSDGERQIFHDITEMQNQKKKIQMHLFTKQTHTLKEQTYRYQG